ncbi:MAG: hypothetical protein WC881_05415 [Elusimicrobiota bacterium]|jgi:hypothetical protein
MPDVLGMLGGACLLLLIVSGFLRPRLGAIFLKWHRAGTVALTLALAAHAAALYAESPRAGWHIAGGAALAGALATAAVGRLRMRIGARWFNLHKAAALAVLAVAGGHIWLQP